MEKEILEEIVKEMKKKYNAREDFVKLLIKLCLDNGINDIKNKIDAFLSNS